MDMRSRARREADERERVNCGMILNFHRYIYSTDY